MRELTQEEINRHNALTEKGWALIEGELLLNEPAPVGGANWFTRRKLAKAIDCFEQALQINPESMSSCWALGKIYQRLLRPTETLNWFYRAHQVNPTQTDVAREAGLAALDLGAVDLALSLCRTAVELDPNDAGLVANLSWAYLISGDVGLAQTTIQKAIDADPGDEISRNVRNFIDQVADGKRPLPKTLLEVNRMH